MAYFTGLYVIKNPYIALENLFCVAKCNLLFYSIYKEMIFWGNDS